MQSLARSGSRGLLRWPEACTPQEPPHVGPLSQPITCSVAWHVRWRGCPHAALDAPGWPPEAGAWAARPGEVPQQAGASGMGWLQGPRALAIARPWSRRARHGPGEPCWARGEAGTPIGLALEPVRASMRAHESADDAGRCEGQGQLSVLVGNASRRKIDRLGGGPPHQATGFAGGV